MISQNSITAEAKQRHIIYALSVVKNRAIPDVRDGLKPIHRRILFTMYHDLNLDFTGRTRKCAKIVGDVTGNYHPHGTNAAYESLARLAQNWELNQPLVIGQGNFGSIDGDPPAAERYTEAKLAEIANFLLLELDQNTVNYHPNYDNTRQEPDVLPARFPNLLVNGTDGIAVGMASKIPAHNLTECIDAAIALIDDSNANLLTFIKGPDFPTGGKVIAGKTLLKSIYESGEGTVTIEPVYHTEGNNLVITQIPYGTETNKLEQQINELLPKLSIIKSVNNESNERDGLRLVIETSYCQDKLIMSFLCKYTDLRKTFSYNCVALVPYKGTLVPKQNLSLREILQYFIKFRFDITTRKLNFELEKLNRRIHLLNGLKIILDNLDEAIGIIKKSSNKVEAKGLLSDRFKLDEVQAEYVVMLNLYKISQTEVKDLISELEDKTKRKLAIEEILSKEGKIWDLVKSDLLEVRKLGNKRRTVIVDESDLPVFDDDLLISAEDLFVQVGVNNTIKKLSSSPPANSDGCLKVISCNNRDNLILFFSSGYTFVMKVNDIEAKGRGLGDPIDKYFSGEGKVVGATIAVAGKKVLLVSESGIKKEIVLKPEDCTLTNKNGRKTVVVGKTKLVKAVVRR